MINKCQNHMINKYLIISFLFIGISLSFATISLADPATENQTEQIEQTHSPNTMPDTLTSKAQSEASTIRILLDTPIIALFVIIAFGLMLGQINIYGVSLGTSGVIFSALAFGSIGCIIPGGVGTLGLVLFIYCVGISAGPGFFRAFAKQGTELAKFSVIIGIIGAATACILAYLVHIPRDLAAGIFAGAMTSTPALASAMDALPDSSLVSVGYGIAYPFGVIGVVLFIQLLPRLLKIDLKAEADKYEKEASKKKQIQHILVEILNPSVIGKRINEIPFIADSRCQISRILKGERLVPITLETVFEKGQNILIVGKEHRLPHIIDYLGRRSDKPFYMDTESERIQVVVTSQEIDGRPLGDLNLLSKFGVTVSRINRNDINFVPQASTVIKNADILSVVGELKKLQKFAAFAGHRARVIDKTDIISLSIGIIIGVIIGMIPIALPGSQGFTLGMAGGPLLVALTLSHFGSIGKIRGHIPRASRMLMMDIGLVFFLASAGVKAGSQLTIILQQHGLVLLAVGFAVTITPLIIGYFFARYVLKLNFLQIIGGACGGMTSTPGMGVIANKIESSIPAISYATAYPVALILMTIFAQLIISIL